MPFDSTTFRDRVHTVPPTPPERDGRPLRIVVNIEIIERRRQPPQRATGGYRFGTVTLTLLIVALLLALAGCMPAHAQPSSWQSYREGFMTRYQGSDSNGEPWTGTSYQSGFMTYFDANGPHGETQHCRSWQQGWQTITECD
jgi:hypothetical protein